MTEQFLERPQVRASRKQMRCKTVSERVRRQRLGKAKAPARSSDGAAHQVRIERPATGTDEQRDRPLEREWALPDIVLDRLAYRGNDGDNSHFRSLAGDPERWPQGHHVGRKGHRLCNTQARTVKQQQDRKVACTNPWRARSFGRLLREIEGILGSCWTWQRSRSPGTPGTRKLRGCPLLFRCISEEGADARKLARSRGSPEPTCPALGEKSAQIRRCDPNEARKIDGRSPIMAEEVDQPVRRRCVGAHRVRGPAAVMLEM